MEVVKDLAADGAALAAGTDHGDGTGGEERVQVQHGAGYPEAENASSTHGDHLGLHTGSVRRHGLVIVLPFGILCFQPDVLALQVDRAAYRYPYTDPYLATTTLSIAKGRDVLLADDDVSRRSLEITVLDGRDNAYLLEGKGKLRFRFYQQTGSAPLIFIIPGLGGPAASGSAAYLAEVLVDQGFHVLILPSPFNWNFALAASRSGLPGIYSGG